jgi:hypothetical protein
VRWRWLEWDWVAAVVVVVWVMKRGSWSIIAFIQFNDSQIISLLPYTHCRAEQHDYVMTSLLLPLWLWAKMNSFLSLAFYLHCFNTSLLALHVITQMKMWEIFYLNWRFGRYRLERVIYCYSCATNWKYRMKSFHYNYKNLNIYRRCFITSRIRNEGIKQVN